MNIRKFKITKPVDIYGNEFKPELKEYDLVYTHELFVALGVQGIVLRQISWDNVQEI